MGAGGAAAQACKSLSTELPRMSHTLTRASACAYDFTTLHVSVAAPACPICVQARKRLKLFDAQGLACVAWALCCLRHRPSATWLEDYALEAGRRLPHMGPQVRACSMQACMHGHVACTRLTTDRCRRHTGPLRHMAAPHRAPGACSMQACMHAWHFHTRAQICEGDTGKLAPHASHMYRCTAIEGYA